MGNRFSEAGIVLEKIQSPLLFQLVKEALSTVGVFPILYLLNNIYNILILLLSATQNHNQR